MLGTRLSGGDVTLTRLEFSAREHAHSVDASLIHEWAKKYLGEASASAFAEWLVKDFLTFLTTDKHGVEASIKDVLEAAYYEWVGEMKTSPYGHNPVGLALVNRTKAKTRRDIADAIWHAEQRAEGPYYKKGLTDARVIAECS